MDECMNDSSSYFSDASTSNVGSFFSDESSDESSISDSKSPIIIIDDSPTAEKVEIKVDSSSMISLSPPTAAIPTDAVF